LGVRKRQHEDATPAEAARALAQCRALLEDARSAS